MTRTWWTRWLAASVGCSLLAATLQAQWVVYDPSNYAEAVVQYEQLVQQYQFLLARPGGCPSTSRPATAGMRLTGRGTMASACSMPHR